jgi:hypothetical protein
MSFRVNSVVAGDLWTSAVLIPASARRLSGDQREYADELQFSQCVHDLEMNGTTWLIADPDP